MIEPATTRAILIGIERYDGGAKDLDGPANDVHQVTDWLLARGVPASRLNVLLSPLEKNDAIAKEITNLIHQETKPATDTEIQRAFFNSGLQAEKGSLLCVYWSGHGFIYNNQHRLVCADATSQNLSNHNLDALLTAMQTELFKGFPEQLWIIDSCAEYPDFSKVIPPNRDYPKRRLLSTSAQEVLFSAAPGQRARIHSERKMSWFTQELLDYLQRIPSDTTWIPDIGEITTHLQQRFKELKAEGQTQQIPVYLWRRDRMGSDAHFGKLNPTRSEPFKSYQEELIKEYILQNGKSTPKLSLQAIAWKWLRPGNRDSLENLYQQIATTDFRIQEFYTDLQKTCAAIRDQHPQLKLWIRRKLATLDYEQAKAFALPSDLSTRSIEYNFRLLDIINYLHSEPEKARKQASIVAQKALESAGQVILDTISTQPNDCSFWANLMLPLPPNTLESPLFVSPKAQENIETAKKLWKNCRQANTYLVVAIETLEDPEYLGFWLPVYPNRRTGSPGATAAYYQGHGLSIFVDDLPPLGQDLLETGQRTWHSYVENSLSEQIGFVSIPFFLKTTNGSRRVLAILNVHLYAESPEICLRAYEREWLQIAERQATPLICEAYKAAIIWYGAKDGTLPLVDSNLRHFPI